MHRSLETRMRDGVIVCVLVLIAAQILMAADPAMMESTKAREDVAPSTTQPSHSGAELAPSIRTKLLPATENFEFLNQLTKEQRSDLSNMVRDMVTRGRVLLAVERYKKGRSLARQSCRACWSPSGGR